MHGPLHYVFQGVKMRIDVMIFWTKNLTCTALIQQLIYYLFPPMMIMDINGLHAVYDLKHNA